MSYIVLLIIVAVISVASALYVRLRHPVPGSKTAVWIALAGAEWMVGYAFELVSVEVQTKVFWNRMQYVGIVVAMVGWLVFALRYTGREKWLNRRTLALLCVEPVVVLLLVFTNDAHGLIWGPVALDTSGPFSVLVHSHGIGYWIHVLYVYTSLFVVVFMLFQMLALSSRLYRRQVSVLLFAACLPLVGSLFMLSGLNPRPYLDLTPLAFTVSSLILSWSLFRLRVGDIVPVARGLVIESMSDGVLVLDEQNRVVDLNPVAGRIIGHSAAEALGRAVEEIWPAWPDLIERPSAEVVMDDGAAVFSSAVSGQNRLAYDVRISPIADWRGHLTGQVVVLRDVTERKRVEDALRESEERYRLHFESVNDVVFSLAPDLRLRSISPSVERVLGYRPEELVNRSLQNLDILAPEDLETAVADVRRVLAGERVTASVYEFVARDGSRKFGEVSGAPLIRDSKVVAVIAVARDITGRVRVEEALRQYAERLRALYAIGGAILAAWSAEEVAQTALRHIRQLVPCLASGIVMLDFEIQEAALLAVQSDGDAGPEAGKKFSLEGFVDIEALLQGKVHVVEDVSTLPQTPLMVQALQPLEVRSCVAVPLIAQGELIGSLALVADTPAAFSAEHVDVVHAVADQVAVALHQARLYSALAADRQRLKALIEHLPEGILLLDSERHILLSNPAAEVYLPTLTDEAVGEVLTHLGDCAVDEVLSPRSDRSMHELEVLGPPKWVFEVDAQPIKSEARVEGWVVLIRDVTEEREVQQRVQQRERLAAVGQLAAGIAHDFNNIIAAIVLHAQLMLRKIDLSSESQERLATIVQQSKQAARLVEQILDFSRRSVLERQPLDMEPLFKEFVKLLKRTLSGSILVELSVGPGEYVVSADPTRIQQAMMNLALNARDAMPEGGKLSIGLERLRLDSGGVPPLPEMEEGEWVRVTVTDTGTGISPDILSHIYEPFFTTKTPGQGSGLGLAQVYGIVMQHEGYIDVDSDVGRGTTFSLYLPALPTPEVEPRTSEEATVAKGQGEMILVVEDSPAPRKALCDALEMLGYRVLVAASGQEALGLFKRHAADLALVVSDLVMPKMGGRELMREMRKRDPHLKALAVTGYALAGGIEELREDGFLEVVRKPFEVSALAKMIRRILDEE
jgi:PAS domain S-box-containing protein